MHCTCVHSAWYVFVGTKVDLENNVNIIIAKLFESEVCPNYKHASLYEKPTFSLANSQGIDFLTWVTFFYFAVFRPVCVIPGFKTFTSKV